MLAKCLFQSNSRLVLSQEKPLLWLGVTLGTHFPSRLQLVCFAEEEIDQQFSSPSFWPRINKVDENKLRGVCQDDCLLRESTQAPLCQGCSSLAQAPTPTQNSAACGAGPARWGGELGKQASQMEQLERDRLLSLWKTCLLIWKMEGHTERDPPPAVLLPKCS